ncbi:uncharacterized protein LOC131656637 [Vicia villosa]|uniref:uncharacterized protein LOC131656637 n=1 Tax=Vicia villosa TaxID=3911 RepID=UPI00273C8BFF|nr:uncharacterized protein LOC131656637 [Vicia villosa]
MYHSLWWRDLKYLDKGEGDCAKDWFVNKLAREVGNGKETLLWVDPWLEGKSLKGLYPDLFRKAGNKNDKVGDLSTSQNGGLFWNGSWEVSLDTEEARKEEELKDKIQSFSLRDNVRDRWKWFKNDYSVKEAYCAIMKEITNVRIEDRELAAAWSKLVPLKVSTLVWRIWQNRIPSRDNLVSIGILVASQNSCPYGCGSEENVSHIFFECLLAWIAWSEVLRWLDFISVSHNSAVQNFVQFAGLSSGGRVIIERFCVIWFACIWVIWKRRNEKIFRNSENSSSVCLEDIEMLSWRWLRANIKGFSYSLNQWISNPKICLGWRGGTMT